MTTGDNSNRALVDALRARGLTIAVAESLTGGGLCSHMVDVPGASDVVRGGVCTYATDTKHSLLRVDQQCLAAHGPVNPEVATQMALHVADLFGADLGVATTGVAGPGPADGHPAGTVYIACALKGKTHVTKYHFDGDRPQVRQAAINTAISIALNLLETAPEL